jgi:MFS transporter, ACS family, allantoate permease
MAQVPASDAVPMDDEKKSAAFGAEAEASVTVLPAENVASSDGDDALKLVGTHAHQFDEKYYLRLRRKIVSLDASAALMFPE